MARLDTRLWLKGETRLSDAQVLCLRDAAGPGLTLTDAGWTAGGRIHRQDTVRSLSARMLIGTRASEVTLGLTVAVALEQGRKILAAIDAANARATS